MTHPITTKIPFPFDNVDEAFTPRILLVDDEPNYLLSITDIINEYDTEIFSVTTGLDALRLLSNETFDLVLLDLNLPDLDGFVIMDFIRSRELGTDFIVLSGQTEIDAAINAYNRGAYRYLHKPYSPEDLVSDIKNVLKKRKLEVKANAVTWKMQYSEHLYRSLINHVPDIIYTLNEKGQITFINESVNRLLKYSPEELIDQHHSILITEEDRQQAEIAFKNRGNKTSPIELRLKPKEEGPRVSVLMTLKNLELDFSGSSQNEQRNETRTTYIIARDISETKRAAEIISFHTNYDALTGLPNRILMHEKLDVELENAKNSQIGLTILFIDLDRFKLINDTLGHINGDLLLQQVAYRLKEVTRYNDIVARLGSDEFILCIPGMTELEQAEEMACTCLAALSAPFEISESKTLTITASIGIAIYPVHGQNAEELLSNADIAMSEIKAQGKNGIGVYNTNMAESSQIKLSNEYALRRALERRELEMYYQPQIHLESGKIVGAESLMRWNHPDHGLLPAGDFLPIAEENGLILPITDWMLEAVCRDIQICRVVGNEPVPISINISPQYLDRCNFTETLEKLIIRYGIPKELIHVEITENICIRNPANAINQLNRLSELGIHIAIDDFGTGYSSLAYLHRFPIQTIKIDRSFVNEIQRYEGDYPVILAIISIAQGLGMNLIAEGVENDIQAKYLQKWGCEIMQGYLYYKPLPLKTFINTLSQKGLATVIL